MTAARIDEPQPGFFRTRIVKGGPLVVAEIRYGPALDPDTGDTLDRPHLWEALIAGRHVRTPSPDPIEAGVFRIWGIADPIDEATARFMMADAAWCAEHAPARPQANPRRPARLRDAPKDLFRR